MPKLQPAPQRLDQLSLVIQSANAYRLAVGWLVAREAGIDSAPLLSQVGSTLMEPWAKARRLPAMLNAFQPEARLMYRLRALCLQLHHHPAAAVCGGAERWWQHILEEQILCAICQQLMPQLFPGEPVSAPRIRATSTWWARRGVNPFNPVTEPATWVLIESVMGRLFRGRGCVIRPADEVPLPIEALNGVMSLRQRKELLATLTGGADGWTPYTGIELYRDWAEMLNAWQATSQAQPTKGRTPPYRTRNPEREQALAVVLHDALIPPWWASRQRIREELDQMRQQKPFCSRGSNPIRQNQPTSGG